MAPPGDDGDSATMQQQQPPPLAAQPSAGMLEQLWASVHLASAGQAQPGPGGRASLAAVGAPSLKSLRSLKSAVLPGAPTGGDASALSSAADDESPAGSYIGAGEHQRASSSGGPSVPGSGPLSEDGGGGTPVAGGRSGGSSGRGPVTRLRAQAGPAPSTTSSAAADADATAPATASHELSDVAAFVGAEYASSGGAPSAGGASSDANTSGGGAAAAAAPASFLLAPLAALRRRASAATAAAFAARSASPRRQMLLKTQQEQQQKQQQEKQQQRKKQQAHRAAARPSSPGELPLGFSRSPAENEIFRATTRADARACIHLPPGCGPLPPRPAPAPAPLPEDSPAAPFSGPFPQPPPLVGAPARVVAADAAYDAAYRSAALPLAIGRYVPGCRYRADPPMRSRLTTHLNAAFALATLCVYMSMAHIFVGTILAAPFWRPALFGALALTVLAVLPLGEFYRRDWLENAVIVSWRRYFSYTFVFDSSDLRLDGRYLLAEVPHAVYPLSQVIAFSLERLCWPGHMVTAVAASAVFGIPVWRHAMHWIGCAPATAANFRALLKKSSAGVVPGGIAEMYLIRPDKEVYKLRDRKGFVRIAVETGWPVIPVIHLGQSQLLRWGPAWLQPLARRCRVSLGFIFGIGNLPLPIPSRRPLMMVVGGSIPVRHLQRGEPGFDAEVDRVLAATVASCASMYARYAPLYGWGGRPLEIA